MCFQLNCKNFGIEEINPRESLNRKYYVLKIIFIKSHKGLLFSKIHRDKKI